MNQIVFWQKLGQKHLTARELKYKNVNVSFFYYNKLLSSFKQLVLTLSAFTQFRLSLCPFFIFKRIFKKTFSLKVLCVNPNNGFTTFCHVCLGERCWGFRGGPQGRPGFVSFTTSSTSISKYSSTQTKNYFKSTFG